MASICEVFRMLREDSNFMHEKLVEFSDEALRPYFPSLIRLCLCPEPFAGAFEENKRETLRLRLLGNSDVNAFIQLMNVDFSELDSDIKKETASRSL